ncbi:hypothetical protein GCM10009839_16900 [Catenulispora yoronensis]|uniref:DUF6879 domain-containing protein n=1 Tax=Catenulispora yoronensis TaxID=450799 RepID=A0ABP5FC63_9ACTN
MAQSIDELMEAANYCAVHLEMRDDYTPVSPGFVPWQEGYRGAPTNEGSRNWRKLVAKTVARGVSIRRARIVSEPLSDYVQYEYDITSDHNIKAGEQVSWLPRGRASEIMLPGNDFWIFDNRIVMFQLFAGNGAFVDATVTETPEVVARCVDAFEAIWTRSIPHDEYRPAT